MVFSVVNFAEAGIPFLNMAVPKLRERKPGMMTLISLAVSVAVLCSVTAQFLSLSEFVPRLRHIAALMTASLAQAGVSAWIFCILRDMSYDGNTLAA